MNEASLPPSLESDIGSGDSLPFQCEQCERSFATAGGLKRHVTTVHSERRKSEPESEEGHQVGIDAKGNLVYKAPTQALQKTGDTLISNIATIGTMAAILAPHTGITILSRAPLLGKGIMEIASGNESVMRGVERFNTMFTGGELVTAVASIGVALTVDVGVTDSHGKLPSLLIGDVVQQVDAIKAASENSENE